MCTIVFGGTCIIVHLCVLVNTKCTEGGLYLSNCKLTDFGLQVKTELLKRGKRQVWLEQEVAKRTGLYCDNGYMYKILTGAKATPKIVKAICEILDITDTPTS